MILLLVSRGGELFGVCFVWTGEWLDKRPAAQESRLKRFFSVPRAEKPITIHGTYSVLELGAVGSFADFVLPVRISTRLFACAYCVYKYLYIATSTCFA